MLFWLRIVAAVLVLALTLVESQNYCNSSLCPNGRRHIACNNNGAFTRNCPAGAFLVNMQPLRRLVRHLHNEKRNRIAGGGVPGYRQASRMAVMQWNDELARIAAFNVKQCQMRHDACRNTQRFPKSGQNLAIMQYTGRRNRLSNQRLVRKLVNLWFNEYRNANMNIINRYPSNYNGRPIGHFTVMVADRNTHLGCAAARYTRRGTHYFLLACNYASTNIIGRPLYVSGNATSGCQTGRNSYYNNLCSPNETY